MNPEAKNPNELNYQDYTILIVDDTPANLGVVADYLEGYGFEIRITRSGEKALQRAKLAQPDIILLDVMMPGIDGFETCRRLKADEVTKNIPVIFMTGLVNPEDKVKGFEVGGVDYVTKPLYQKEVLARITTHLRIRNLTCSLQQSNQELAALNATKDKFFSIVAHDLRGPFHPLLSVSELLSTIPSTTPHSEIQEMGKNVHQTAKGVYNLLENLLQWSQLERGRISYKPIQLDLRKIVVQNINLFAKNAAAKGITLQSTVVKEAFVYADENMLDIVIRNLVSNALKFTPINGRVTISAKLDSETPEFAEVSVLDTGVGIAHENLHKLFRLETHHTTEGTAREKGTGLGLILCREMVEKNGGQIWIESNGVAGQGSSVKFTVRLDNSNPNTANWPENDAAKIVDEASSETAKPIETIEDTPSYTSQTQLNELLNLANRGNMMGLEKQATHLETLDKQLGPFANRLRQLAKNFEDELILTFLEQYKEQNP